MLICLRVGISTAVDGVGDVGFVGDIDGGVNDVGDVGFVGEVVDFSCEECDYALLKSEFHFLPPRILGRVRRLVFPIRRLVVEYSKGRPSRWFVVARMA